jgi:hypothetical protein
MRRSRQALTVLGLLALAVAGSAAGAKPKPVRPVIGKATATPAVAQAGSPFAVAFKVTRSDTGKALAGAKATWTASAGGRAVAHTSSFRAGTARISFTVPDEATAVRVGLKVTLGRVSASKAVSFAVRPLPPPSLSIGDVSAAEGSAAAPGKLSFPVTLSGASKKTVTVSFATADGTAKAPADYTAATGTVTFAPGETAKTVDVAVVGELAAEPDETLTVTLSGPVNATLARDTGTGTITNDDVAPKAGHYHGPTTGKDFVDFDLSSDLVVSKFNMSIEVVCDKLSGPQKVDLQVNDHLPIDPATGKFSGSVGNDKTFANFAGTLLGPDQANGTADATLDIIYLGQHIHCAGSVSWNASLVS